MKIRLDNYLFQNKLCESRERAKAMVMAGIVYVNGEKQDKPGTPVNEDANVEVRGKPLAYVSRGGLKLEKAISEFSLNIEGKVCMDIGASTGGFTDCMLQNNAQKVFAVDVGYGQLAWTLRNDERVVNMERTNIRNVTLENLQQKIDFFSVDVSFISLKHILPVANAISSDNASGVCLIKPQFEAGRENVGKNGVVRDEKIHIQVIESTCNMAVQNGFSVLKLSYSPIKGPKGNMEFLMYIEKSLEPQMQSLQNIEEIVSIAHTTL